MVSWSKTAGALHVDRRLIRFCHEVHRAADPLPASAVIWGIGMSAAAVYLLCHFPDYGTIGATGDLRALNEFSKLCLAAAGADDVVIS